MTDGASFHGRAFGRYHLQDVVAVSGMGVVYRAWDPTLECTVALKLISDDTIADTLAGREQLLAEARIASHLNHPNICIIKDVVEASGQAGIVMEFVEGQVLTKLISAHGRLPFEDIVDYGIKIAAAVSHAHERDVIHRDLKSANVMVTPDGRIKLLDFGLSKIKRSTEVPSSFVTPGLNSSSRSIVGTPHYWPPEVINLGPSDARNDIWSMGVLLYEMTSGSMPFDGQSLKELVEAILHEAPTPLSNQVQGQLAKIIHRCLHKQIGQRYQRASEIRAALEAIQPIGEYRQPTKIVSEPVPIRSVAVLPLEDVSGTPGQEYFADGLTESLITALTKISGLHVISRVSIMQYKGVRKTVPTIARELGVDAIVEGSVRRVDDRVRISAELIQASTEQNLWAESYERDLKDILSLQSQVALAIARNIKEKVIQTHPSPHREAGLPLAKSAESASLLETWNLTVDTKPEASVNPEAYDLYLRGRHFWNRQNTFENFRKAAEYYQRAIEVDPESAVTYAGLAHCLILMGAGEYGLTAPADIMPKAKSAATKALSIEESLAEAHVSLAMVQFRYEHDWTGAEPEFVRAIDLNRGYAVAHYCYAVYLMGLSRFDEALREVKIAQELDPLSPTFHHSLGLLFYTSGQFDEAIEHLRGTIAMDPNFPLAHLTQGLALLPKARFDEAIEAIQRSLQIAGEIPLWRGFLGQAYALAGRRNEALQILNDLLSIRKERYVPAAAIALVYSGLGQKEQAFEWLNKAAEERDGLLIYLKVGAVFDGVRKDRRFLDLLNRVGLQELAPVQPVSKTRAKLDRLTSPSNPHKRITYGVVLAIALLAGGVATWKYFVPSPVAPSRLAILPFENLSSDSPEAQRISEGLTQEMTSSLELLHPHSLAVVQLPPSAATLTSAQIVDKYNSGYLLHGTVLLVNHKVAVTVQLILTADQTGIWGDSYERDIDKPEDIIPIMVEIATTIRAAVLEHLPKDLHPVHQVNQQAYESYLTGRFFWNKRTTEDLQKAVSYFEASIAEDPDYAPAYAGLADSYSLLGSAPYTFLPPKVAFPKAEAAAYKALTLDPYLAEAHVSLGYSQLSYERDYPKADQEFLEAIRLQPAYATAHQYYAYYLTAMGDLKEAIRERQQARDLDPLSPLLNSAVGEAYYQDRQYDLTIAANQKALQLDPSYAIALVNLGRAYEEKKMYAQASTIFGRMLAGAPNDPAVIALVAHDYAVSGRRAEAVQLLSRLQSDAAKHYVPALYFAIIYIGLDNKTEAFNWLNKAYDERCDYLANLPTEPFADPLRSDPRFAELLQRLGLKPLQH